MLYLFLQGRIKSIIHSNDAIQINDVIVMEQFGQIAFVIVVIHMNRLSQYTYIITRHTQFV